MKLFLTAMVVLFGLVGSAHASGGQFFTLDCPQDARLEMKRQGLPNTVRVRCLVDVPSRVNYPKCPLGSKLTIRGPARA